MFKIDWLFKNRSFQFYTNGKCICVKNKIQEILNLDISGYYFGNSLHFYGCNTLEKWDDICYINEIFKSTYSVLIGKDIECFAEDIFGNQFCIILDQFYFLNIETAEISFISSNLNDFLSSLYNDVTFYSGYNLTNDMNKYDIISLSNGHRLCPRKPFVIGGDYETKNLFLSNFNTNLETNFSFAKQVYNLPDGQDVEIRHY
jgi:hypothetical protein